MGAIDKPSLKDLQKVLKCTDRQIKKIGKQMAEAVIRGSLEIWKQDTCERHEEYREQEQEIIQQEITELHRGEVEAEVLRKEESDEENELEEDEEREKWDIEDKRDDSRDEDQDRQKSRRDQLRNEGRWIREEGGGEREKNGNMAGDDGDGLSE
jgi:hypothetical protein